MTMVQTYKLNTMVVTRKKIKIPNQPCLLNYSQLTNRHGLLSRKDIKSVA